MYSVYQHWDPLKVCVVGRSYPPEFYSWITVPHVRELFERIATETEEDYQNIIKKLEEFGVEVLRPNIENSPGDLYDKNHILSPPMTPRDYTVMIGNTFYVYPHCLLDDSNTIRTYLPKFYNNVRGPDWPKECNTLEDFALLPQWIQDECYNNHGLHNELLKLGKAGRFDEIFNHIKNQGNEIIYDCHPLINGAMVSRIGKDLYFGTERYDQDTTNFKKLVNNKFTTTRNHIVNTGGHLDATYCPVAPGLIISLYDVPSYKDTFPGWEVVYLPGQSWNAVEPFLNLKRKNGGKWWIPGFEQDQDVINVVESWLGHWTGYVEETVFDVNMLIIDPKNVMVFSYNKQVFDALERYGITPHVVPFRHRYFWDGGIHCVTSDLHREGTMQDYFPERG